MKPTFAHRRIRRRGAAAVEFSIAASVLFLFLFACFEFGRVLMIESFAEQAAFRAARHVAVLGATIDEGVELANEELNLLGISNAEVLVEPSSGGRIEDQIHAETEVISVRVRIPLNKNMAFSPLFRNQTMEKKAVLLAERITN